MMATPTPSEDAAAPAGTGTTQEPNDTAAAAAATEATVSYRVEHDLIGDEKVPKDAYYGIQTQRA